MSCKEKIPDLMECGAFSFLPKPHVRKPAVNKEDSTLHSHSTEKKCKIRMDELFTYTEREFNSPLDING